MVDLMEREDSVIRVGMEVRFNERIGSLEFALCSSDRPAFQTTVARIGCKERESRVERGRRSER